MRRIRVARGAGLSGAVLTLVLLAAGGVAEAQYFGRNKVEYQNFDYRLLRTAHFDIYYDRQDERTVHHAARMAERWYSRLSRILDHEFNTRQPLMLYGSHPEFGQTNVVSGVLDESIGGVTESGRRRIAMPFAASLADTDHVLGHEIVHAFQFDMAKRNRISRAFPLWFAEGMAEYLSVGARDPLTAAWLRDALRAKTFPRFEKLAQSRVAPYRFGHAAWAWLVSEFGEATLRDMLRRPPSNKLLERLAAVTGRAVADLSTGWEAGARASVAAHDVTGWVSEPVIPAAPGRLQIAPALSPDGERIAFVSERDGFSVDLFVADRATGHTRKLLTATHDVGLESLQYVHSAGAWRHDGRHIAFAAVRGGASVLLFINPVTGAREREIRLPQFGEVLTPTWSPDGSAIAFAALDGGVTDLYIYELGREALRRVTHDAYADLQPAWSPDGKRLAFATDRFTSDLDRLDFGPLQLAVVDVDGGSIEPVPTPGFGKAINPQWSPDGRALYFVAERGGISDVYRLDVTRDIVTRVTATATSVTGLTSSSPALSVAARAGTVVFSTLERGRFEIRALTPDAAAGWPVDAASANASAVPRDHGWLAPVSAGGTVVSAMLADAGDGLPGTDAAAPMEYTPRLGLDGIFQPFVSSGANRFGSFFRAGASMMFDDLMGEQILGVAWQAGTRVYDLGLEVRYLNRERRWNWGVAAELRPLVRTRSIGEFVDRDGRRALEQDTELRLQTSTRFGGSLAYPFSRAQRVEFGAGIRHLEFERELRSQTRLMPSGKLLSDTRRDLPAAGDVVLGEASVAFVHDSAGWGNASPRFGSRWRVEATQAAGELSFTTLSADYRRYFMPAKAVTIAARVAPSVRVGGQADDPRLFPMYAGSRVPVRGYYGRTLTADCAAREAEGCVAGDDLFGHRLVAGNLEVRVPFSPFRARVPVRAEAVAFADAAFLWASDPSGADRLLEHRIRSVGAGVRLNALGMLLEIDAVRPLDRARNGWTLGIFARPGF